MVWEFTNRYLDFVADKKEWIGTTGRFDITEEHGLIRVTFNVGLT